MQNVQLLSHPIWIVTQAECSASRRTGRADGNASGVLAGRLGEDLHHRPVTAGVVDEFRGPVHVVGAEHHVDVTGPLPDQLPILLGEAPGHRDERVGSLGLHRLEPAQGAVQLVVGVLPDAAGVEHHDVGVLQDGGALVPVVLEQPGDPLGIVLVHLAPEGADGVGSGHRPRLEPRSRRASGQLISRRS